VISTPDPITVKAGLPSDKAAGSITTGRRQRTGLVTVLFTDIVNSTALKQQLGNQASRLLFDRHHELLRETLAGFSEGQEVETAGDSFLIVFSAPSEAVQFALLAQSRLPGLQSQTGVALSDRIGIHLGEVVIKDDHTSVKPMDLYAGWPALAPGCC
jgi:class 3 adenylate cyclase